MNKKMKEDMIRTNNIIHNNKLQILKSQRENDKKMELDYSKFINTKGEALLEADNRRKNSYVQIMKDGLKKQINDKCKTLEKDKKSKMTDEQNSTGLNLPSYSDFKTTACSDCGNKYQKNMLTKVKKMSKPN